MITDTALLEEGTREQTRARYPDREGYVELVIEIHPHAGYRHLVSGGVQRSR